MPAHFLVHFLGPLTIHVAVNSELPSRSLGYGDQLLWTDQLTMANTGTDSRSSDP